MENKISNPRMPRNKENKIAEFKDSFFFGKGLFLVRSISPSTSTSKTWFRPLEEPTMKKPPKINFNKIIGSCGVFSLIASK